jgi:hypothetical protein
LLEQLVVQAIQRGDAVDANTNYTQQMAVTLDHIGDSVTNQQNLIS